MRMGRLGAVFVVLRRLWIKCSLWLSSLFVFWVLVCDFVGDVWKLCNVLGD